MEDVFAVVLVRINMPAMLVVMHMRSHMLRVVLRLVVLRVVDFATVSVVFRVLRHRILLKLTNSTFGFAFHFTSAATDVPASSVFVVFDLAAFLITCAAQRRFTNYVLNRTVRSTLCSFCKSSGARSG